MHVIYDLSHQVTKSGSVLLHPLSFLFFSAPCARSIFHLPPTTYRLPPITYRLPPTTLANKLFS